MAADLLALAAGLAVPGRRRLLGLAGPPGVGKSTLAAQLVADLDGLAALVPMDGFHLAQAELERLGRAGRKGAPDTFDAPGFVALLGRLADQRPGLGATGETVYAPRFDRHREEPVAGAIAVEAEVPLVVVEGNYLLQDEGAWARVAPLLDECWYLDLDPATRRERLVARHVAHGRSPEAALAWVLGTDEPNAELISRGRGRATRHVLVP
ncbi:nucleoside/nucleotide kinase family protein [Actinotalea soli]|uniref:nucleoside/nucleotide kinase family protein n=1 Tax=Actinotalea soli TaxID=2819234 RepID=UPI0027DD1586|nr:nucleoside/nucleotide kinase family protein [Actinotalea soli]